MTLTGLAIRNLARHRFRVALTVLGVSIAILAFYLLRTITWSLASGAEFSAKDRLITRNKTTFVLSLPKRYVPIVAGAPHVKAVTWQSWFGGRDPKRDREFFGCWAVDAETIFSVYDDMKVPPDQLRTFRQDRQGAIVGDVLARKFGWKVGDRVTLVSGLYLGDWQFTVDGIYAVDTRSVDRSNFLFHWEYLNDGAPFEGRDMVGWIVSRIDEPGRGAEVGQQIDKLLEDRGTPTLTQDEGTLRASLLGMLSAVLKAMDLVSAVILVIMTLIVSNTIAMAARERTSEYGVLRAIGFLPAHVVLWVVGESIVMGIVGGLLGAVLAWPIINLVLGRVLEENMGRVFPYFRLETNVVAIGVALAAALAGIAAAIPAWRASRLQVVEALRRVG